MISFLPFFKLKHRCYNEWVIKIIAIFTYDHIHNMPVLLDFDLAMLNSGLVHQFSKTI